MPLRLYVLTLFVASHQIRLTALNADGRGGKIKKGAASGFLNVQWTTNSRKFTTFFFIFK
jgi:hypothetical protein